MDEPPDGAALRRQWDALCDRTRTIVEQAQQRALSAGADGVARYLDRQLTGLQSLKASADGRRAVPGRTGTGLMYDIPPELPEYEDAYNALNTLVDFWREGMRVPGWDWAADGYPPGWTSGFGDRLRAGLFYRAR